MRFRVDSQSRKSPPLLPWQRFSFVTPETFIFGQGFAEYWCLYIWMPYWNSLSEEEQVSIINEAPTIAWSKWLKMSSARSEEIKNNFYSHMFFGRSLPPSPPWKVFYGADPDLFTCTQGNEEFWCANIWMPYWCSLSEKQKLEILNSAPTEAWAEWIRFRDVMCEF